MNLLDKKTGLILGLALFLFACEEPGEIGLNLSPNTGDFIISSIEIPVTASVGITEPYLVSDTTRQYFNNDTIISALNHRIISVGKKTDSDYGNIELTGYCDLVSKSDTLKVPETYTYIESEISIITKNYFGIGPVYKNQILRIHELDEEVQVENYVSTKYAYKDTPLAELTLDVDTSYLVSSKIFNTILPDEFGKRILDEAKANLITNKNLKDYLKGFAFVPDQDNNLLFQIDPKFYESNLTIRFNNGSQDDSLVFFFSNRPSYSSEVDYTGTELAGLIENQPSDVPNNIYLNSVNGTFMEMDLTAIQELKDSIGPMVINTAELIIEDVEVDSLYPISSSFTLNAFEKRPEFDFSRQSYFLYQFSNGTYNDTNLFLYRFDMSLTRYAESRNKGLLYVSNTVQNKYKPVDRNPAFVDFIQDIVATDSRVEEAKYYLFMDSFGKSFQQLRFNKENIRLKLYFSYLRDDI